MMPEAPVRFSTMNCCLSESESFAANRRASGSTEPPGGYGETNLTGLVGQSCARAGKTQSSKRYKSLFMSVRPDVVVLHHLAPALHLAHQPLLQGVRRARHQIHAERFGEGFFDVSQSKSFFKFGMELVQDRPGRAGGREDAPPGKRGEALETLLREGRHLRHRMR